MSPLVTRGLLLTLMLTLPGCIFLSEPAPSATTPDMAIVEDILQDLPPAPDATPDQDEAPDESGPICDSSSLARCGDTCHDLQTDPLHCGACDRPCEGDTSCVGGVCVADVPCGADEDRCEGSTSCVRLDTSAHCGSCDISCGVNEACQAAMCVCTLPEPIGTTLINRLPANALLRVVALPREDAVGQHPLQANYRVIALEPMTRVVHTVGVNALGQPVGSTRTFALELPDATAEEQEVLTAQLNASANGGVLITLLTRTGGDSPLNLLERRSLWFYWLNEGLTGSSTTISPVQIGNLHNLYRDQDIRGVKLTAQGADSYLIATLERARESATSPITTQLKLHTLMTTNLIPALTFNQEIKPILATVVPIAIATHPTDSAKVTVGFEELSSLTAPPTFNVFKPQGATYAATSLSWRPLSGLQNLHELALAWRGEDVLIFASQQNNGLNQSALTRFGATGTVSPIFTSSSRTPRMMFQHLGEGEWLLELAQLSGQADQQVVRLATRPFHAAQPAQSLGDVSATKLSELPGSGYIALEGALSERTRRASMYFTLERMRSGAQSGTTLALKAWPRVEGDSPCGELTRWAD